MEFVARNRVGTRLKQRSVGSKRTARDLQKWLETLIRTGDWGVGMTHGLTYGYDAFRNPQLLWEHWDQVKANKTKYGSELSVRLFPISKKRKRFI